MILHFYVYFQPNFHTRALTNIIFLFLLYTDFPPPSPRHYHTDLSSSVYSFYISFTHSSPIFTSPSPTPTLNPTIENSLIPHRGLTLLYLCFDGFCWILSSPFVHLLFGSCVLFYCSWVFIFPHVIHNYNLISF